MDPRPFGQDPIRPGHCIVRGEGWMGEGHKNVGCKKGEGHKIWGTESGEGHENIRPPFCKICGPPSAVSNGGPLSQCSHA